MGSGLDKDFEKIFGKLGEFKGATFKFTTGAPDEEGNPDLEGLSEVLKELKKVNKMFRLPYEKSPTEKLKAAVLSGILAGMNPATPYQKTPTEEVRAALRRYSAEQIEKAYAGAVSAVGKDLEFSSARHLVTGFFGLMSDSVLTLWDPVKQVMYSPVVRGVLEAGFGEGKSPLECLIEFSQSEKYAPVKEIQQATQALKEASENFKRSEDYVQAISDYCQVTGKSPDKVIRSRKIMVGIIQKVYGSIEAYEKKYSGTKKALAEAVDMLENLQKRLDTPTPVTAEPDVEGDIKLSDIGINPAALGSIVKSYSTDAIRFGKALLKEFEQFNDGEIAKYKALAATTNKPKQTAN